MHLRYKVFQLLFNKEKLWFQQLYLDCIKTGVAFLLAPGHKHVPDWVWIVVGILNFMAYTLGKKLASIHFSQWLAKLSARVDTQ